MKMLNWSKMPNNNLKGTVWEVIDDENVTFDEESLVGLFSNEVAKKAPTASGDKPAKKGKINVLDMKRANNIGIMLSRFKLTPEEIAQKVIEMDSSVIDTSTAKNMLKNGIPESSEIAVIQECEDPSRLGTPERFLLAMSTVPNLVPRLNAMIFKSTFRERINEVMPDIKAIDAATKQLKTSKKFQKVMEIILALGNYLNGGSARGTAFGFRFNSLLKVADTKGNDRKTTLVHFLIMTMRKYYPELLDFEKEVKASSVASKVSMPTLFQTVNQLKGGFNLVENQLPNADDHFKKAMADFVSKEKAVFEAAMEEANSMKAAFEAVAVYYGEKPTSQPEEFFSIVSGFVEIFQRTLTQIKMSEEKAKKDEKRAENLAKMKQLKQNQTKPKDLNTMNELVTQMKSGDYFKLKRNKRVQNAMSIHIKKQISSKMMQGK
eukprot:TRINITY_DN2376_c0_g1_i1.p1 TRINITY_DN2376_c0_g1~~TRINITY_DN2376_c0_g1_i1.p1  ORF type:complete len:434 (+),score=86.09 TRINITY_DN2376_c0_g1_i1:136-1437(+)